MTNQPHTITVENLRCGGCSASIMRRLAAMEDVTDVSVDHDAGQVSFVAPANRIDRVREALGSLGYREPGTASGLSGLGARARALVSCAMGKVSAL